MREGGGIIKKQVVVFLILSLMMMTGCSYSDIDLEGTVEDIQSTASDLASDLASQIDETFGAKESDEDSEDEEDKNDKKDDEDDSTSEKPNGVYAVNFSYEMDGNEIHVEYFYSFKEDGTGIASFQDVVPFTWNDKEMDFGGATKEYEIEGDVLKVKEDENEWAAYIKKEGDYASNGDFSEFAGTYQATDAANSAYGGGEPLTLLELGAGGNLIGGGPLNEVNFYPSEEPEKITRNDDGSYKCEYRQQPNMESFEYIIYPKGVIDEKDAGDDFLKDTVYIRVIKNDGGVMDAVYYLEEQAS